jgi:hypothetical protein
MNFVNLINRWFPRCTHECESKTIVRGMFEKADEESKIEIGHNLCHQVGNFNTILVIAVSALAIETMVLCIIMIRCIR